MAGFHINLCGRVVGALACQRDSYLQTLETEVVSCFKWSPPAPDRARPQRELAAAAECANAAVAPVKWLVEFADSVFFPEGGGQPSDHGSITPLLSASEASVPIEYVERQGLRCLFHSPRAFSPGDRVRQTIDFARRWDLMQQHTGQHLLSAIMNSYDNLKTLGWGMGGSGGLNYVDLPRIPSLEEIQAIQNQCNESIRANLPIRVEVSDNFGDDRLPGDYDKTKGVVRVVKIGDLDRNTCCGTHLSQTSHISLILLHSTQPVHAKNCRLYFTAGDRAIRFASASVGALRSIARIVSCADSPSDVVANTKKLHESTGELKRREKKLLSDIAKYEGDRLRSTLQPGKNARVHRADGGLDFINKMVAEVKDFMRECGGVLILTVGEEHKPGHLVLFGEENAVKNMVPKVKEVVSEIKGGGKGEKWQGKVAEWRRGELQALTSLV